MKLRNKKTGEIVDYKIIADYDDTMSGWRLESRDYLKHPTLYYDHIEKIHEEWEDYAPKEPLIKDEKIRKAVRAWAEANDLSQKLRVINEHFDSCKVLGREESHNACYDIEFKSTIAHADKDRYYTIDELCGEEEE